MSPVFREHNIFIWTYTLKQWFSFVNNNPTSALSKTGVIHLLLRMVGLQLFWENCEKELIMRYILIIVYSSFEKSFIFSSHCSKSNFMLERRFFIKIIFEQF